MVKKIYPTSEHLHKLFRYEEGELYWRIKKRGISSKKPIGAGCKTRYKLVMIDRGVYLLHRVIFNMFNSGSAEFIDHINGNTLDNRVENLRAASIYQNNQNTKKSKRNTSGFKNISWDKVRAKWRVCLHSRGKTVSSKRFDELGKAIDYAKSMREQFHGEFANHGMEYA